MPLLLTLSGCGGTTLSDGSSPRTSTPEGSECQLSSLTTLARPPQSAAGSTHAWATQVTFLALDATHVYYATEGGHYSEADPSGPGDESAVWRVDKCGGTPTRLADLKVAVPRVALAVDETDIYWSDGGSVLRMPKEGGPSEVVAEGFGTGIGAVLLDATHVYFWAFGAPTSRLLVRPKSGGSVATLFSSMNGEAPWTDGTYVYAWTGDGTNPTLSRAAAGAVVGAVTTSAALGAQCAKDYPHASVTVTGVCQAGLLLAAPIGEDAYLPGLSAMAFDGSHAYTIRGIEHDTYCPVTLDVVSTDMRTGKEEMLAKGLPSNLCEEPPIAFDDFNVYFATHSGVFGVKRP